MKRLIALLVGALVAAGMSVVPASHVEAASATVPGFPGGVTVVLTFPDMQWNDPALCQYGSVTAVVSGTGVRRWEYEADVTYQLDGRVAWATRDEGLGAGTFVDEKGIYMCPGDDLSGMYEVTGTIWVLVSPSDVGIWVDKPFKTTFKMSAMPTSASLAVPTVSASLTAFSGRVVATSASKGTIGADRTGLVSIELLAGTTWNPIALGTVDTTGNFALAVPVALQPGSQTRASYVGTNTCSPTVSPSQAIPGVALPSPTAKIESVKGNSKLFVNVNPNMRRKYWTFQVQRKNADGSWIALKTYKTQGAKETRTVNLAKGTYRVWVNPKFGYQGAFSTNEVTLKK